MLMPPSFEKKKFLRRIAFGLFVHSLLFSMPPITKKIVRSRVLKFYMWIPHLPSNLCFWRKNEILFARYLKKNVSSRLPYLLQEKFRKIFVELWSLYELGILPTLLPLN